MGGRHSYCSHRAIVLDSTLLKVITINWQDETIIMQAGVIWDDVYNVLKESEYVVISGICSTVGVIGFTSAGGYNLFYIRSFGVDPLIHSASTHPPQWKY